MPNKSRHSRGPRGREAAAKYIYVLSRADGVSKVGISAKPRRRVSTLQVSTPDQIKLFHSERPRKMTALAVETTVKFALAAWNVRGEWFACKPELVR